MIAWIPAALLTVFVALATLFLVIRLRFFSDDGVAGRYAFLIGGVLLISGAGWQIARSSSSYGEWFLVSVYPFLDLIHLLVVTGGAGLMVIGLALYSDYWQSRRDTIETRERKQTLLNDLLSDARKPYQLLQLLEISVRDIVSHMPEASGAVFLINRSRRQFVLGASVGLSKAETSMLEYYPLERNVVSQAVEQGEPMLTGGFEFIDRQGRTSNSRFNSCLILPMVSGMDRIGGIILFAEQQDYFGPSEIQYMNPVAGWLAEKIKSARTARELSMAHSRLEESRNAHAEFISRVVKVVSAFLESDVSSAFCRKMVGLAGSSSVHLCGLSNGELQFHGDSQPLTDLSESYRTALVDAFDRSRPFIINQEATRDDGSSYIAVSTLVYPIPDEQAGAALLLRRDSGGMSIGDSDLKMLEVFALIGRLAITQEKTQQQTITRRKGFSGILGLLRLDNIEDDREGVAQFMERLADVLPSGASALSLLRQPDGVFKPGPTLRLVSETLVGLPLRSGDAVLGDVLNRRQTRFVSGKSQVSKVLGGLDSAFRDRLLKALGERGVPGFLAVAPLCYLGDVSGFILVFLHGVEESERAEWERLLTLAVGLYGIRYAIGQLHRERREQNVPGLPGDRVSLLVNRLNNHMTAVMGTAELLSGRQELPADIKRQIRNIVAETESAAAFLKDEMGRVQKPDAAEPVAASSGVRLDRALLAMLDRIRISGSLYMIADRPRELITRLQGVPPVRLKSEAVERLFMGAVTHFASVAADEDVLSVSTYRREDFVYLDVARHKRDYSSVGHVAGFGTYQPVSAGIPLPEMEAFIDYTSKTPGEYCIDRNSPVPAYLSFKFPVADSPQEPKEGVRRLKLLAIDDQEVILDLVAAMCQSKGYDVVTAGSGTEGLRLGERSAFDLIMVDLAMPDISGLDVARRLHERQPRTPIVLVTGWEGYVDPVELERAGVTRVLNKPFRIEQLTDIIRAVSSDRV